MNMDTTGGGGGRGGFDLIGEDLLQNVVSRLPALSFASAACVSRTWNIVCNRVLSRPKLSSALSLNPSLQGAVKEVIDKVLSEPIRPHFAIVSIAPSFSLQQAHQLITEKLGTRAPVITSVSFGIMGRDVLTSEFKEVQWEVTEDEDLGAHVDLSPNATSGIILTVGFLPGLKVYAIPLLQANKEEPRGPAIDDFVIDIKEYSASVSGWTSPAGVILFVDRETDVKPILEKMDYAMSLETVIVGDGHCQFLYRDNSGENTSTRQCYRSAAVALLFARDRYRPHGIGETQFHVTLSTGVSSIGPKYKAVSVREKRGDYCTWLTARRDGLRENLDGETILNHIRDEIRDHNIQCPALYIGVTESRKCSIGLEKVRWVTSLGFHEVVSGDEEYLYVDGVGIKTGDSFRFYFSDSNYASSSCNNVNNDLNRLKQDCNPENRHLVGGGTTNGNKKEVFGGIMFSCYGRGLPFFGRCNVDSSPFLENFPGVTLAGTFCAGEVGRVDSSLYGRESQGQSSVRCCLHVFSTVYLVMSYTPPLLEQ